MKTRNLSILGLVVALVVLWGRSWVVSVIPTSSWVFFPLSVIMIVLFSVGITLFFYGLLQEY